MDFAEKHNNPNGFTKSKYIRGFLKKYSLNYILGIIALLIVDIAQTRVPIIVGGVIDGIEQQSIELSAIKTSIILLFVIAGIMYAGRILWRFFIFGTGRSIERDIRNDMFAHLEKMSAKYYQKHSPGEVMAYMTNDLEAVRMALAQGILTLFDVIALGTITLFNMVTEIDPLLTLAAVVPLMLIAVSVRFAGKEMFSRFTKRQEAFTTLSDFVQENLSGIKVIKSFVQEDKFIEAFEKENKNTYEKNMKLMKLQSIMHPFMQLISGLALAVTIGYGGYLTIIAKISLGDFTAFIAYLSMLVWPMIAIGITINIFSRGAASLSRVEDILNEPVEIKDNEHTVKIDYIEGNIKFDNLNYKYPDTDNYILQNISFEVKKGQTLGIIGRTGSGKTTMVNLLLRIFDPDKNSIYIDGTDILNIPLNLLRKSIGYVPQDNFLFSDTISNNIDFGLRNSDIDKIKAAAEQAVVHGNIVEFKDGYDTVIGEKGISLSGGQKQRISIARALIKDPEILILDDSVSAVDTDTEEKILHYLNELRSNKTNIIIAHRISTIQDSDLIIVLDEGKITEAGTHKELLKNKGLYYSIYEKQLLEKMLNEQE
ncbi:ABC transporter ATP-binding protein [Sedimentibacter sp.]|uniref:ABC transporter ATP-binding protein n=1 Tax=Sedimentibacter sp. TaxID=1960295 RepID=UPI0028AAF4E3|nr:ABC transporter ATP-binding protein [Sedimentibacter sp.]